MIQSSTVIIFLVHVIFAAKFQRLLTPIKKYSMTQLWGPLVAFKGFHPGLVRWCTMHVLNLGLLYSTNASALLLGTRSMKHSFCVQPCPKVNFGWSGFVMAMHAHMCTCMRGMLVFLFLTWLRVMLCDDKFWPGDTFAAQLSNAFDDFQQFTRARKIPHSQKPFTPRLVSRLHLEYFDCIVYSFDPCMRLYNFLTCPWPDFFSHDGARIRWWKKMVRFWWRQKLTMGVVSWNGSMTRCYAYGPVELFLMKECRWRVCVWAFDAFTGRTPVYITPIPNVTRTSFKQSISFCDSLPFLLDSATNLSGMFGSPVVCHDMSAHVFLLFPL